MQYTKVIQEIGKNFVKCSQHIRVDEMIVQDIRGNAIIVQEIGNNFFLFSVHISVDAIYHGRSGNRI